MRVYKTKRGNRCETDGKGSVTATNDNSEFIRCWYKRGVVYGDWCNLVKLKESVAKTARSGII
jgi:hypothetical protein